jgi:hypothetical protein
LFLWESTECGYILKSHGLAKRTLALAILAAASSMFWCNGVALLKDFDILKEADSNSVVKTFDNVQATAQGKIEIIFSPVINYPLINAIEVLPAAGH